MSTFDVVGHLSVSRLATAVTFAASSALLIAVTVASSFVPLKRIAKLDPVVLLKAE